MVEDALDSINIEPREGVRTRPPRLAVLIGGSGTALQALLDAERQGTLAAHVAVVVSHNPRAAGIERARVAEVPCLVVPLANRGDLAERAQFEEKLLAGLVPYAVDLIILAGWMLVLSARFLATYPDRVINIHPALLPGGADRMMRLADGTLHPVFRGAHAVRDALAAGVTTTGATVHLAAPDYDTGTVLARQEVLILPDDTEERLHGRIKELEHRLLIRAINEFRY